MTLVAARQGPALALQRRLDRLAHRAVIGGGRGITIVAVADQSL
tara:strand:- start:6758 stop:6889 length:132 start_codon:yes stop_codon:yes gene_type:complete